MDCAEDDVCRSSYVRGLLHKPGESSVSAAMSPRAIIQYWHDDASMPGDVADCIDTWRKFSDECVCHLLFNDRSGREFIKTHFGRRHVAAFDVCAHPAMRADYFRLCYLVAFGGFYVDADERYVWGDGLPKFVDGVLSLQPLCYDKSTDLMVPVEEFARASSYSPDWIYYVNNNPLVAPPRHPVLRRALARSTQLLKDPGRRLDVQGTTGPGNLTASLVSHAINLDHNKSTRDFVILLGWNDISKSQWPLSYRNDERNWRLWKPDCQ